MAGHTPPLKKETRGNAITQPRSHAIPKFLEHVDVYQRTR